MNLKSIFQRKQDHTSQAFFEKMYASKADPWAFETSKYERSRYTAIFEALKHRRYAHAFEPGCAIGVLTEQLATLCDRVDATDISPTAIRRTAERCRNLPNVHTTCGALPALIPDGPFNLIVLSEIGYYFEEPILLDLANSLVDRMATSGTLIAAHWLGTSKDHLLHGDRVHEILATIPGVTLEHSERHPSTQHAGFRLDRWCRS